MARLAALVLVSFILQGQAPSPPSDARVSGRVVDDVTKAPIADARVRLMPNGRPLSGPLPEARTDEQGRFTLERLDSGTYRLEVMKPGFAPAAANAVLSNIDVRPGATIQNLTLALQRGGAIAGRVVDANGQPVAEIRVTVQRPMVTGPSAMMTQAGQGAQTNDLGEYRIYGLPPGDYYVQAGMYIGPQITASMRSRLAPTYYPATREIRDAKPVTVTAGDTASAIDVRMESEALFEIHGLVVDARGQPAEAMVTVVGDRTGYGGPMIGPGMSRIQSQRDGTFVAVNLPKGGYTVTAGLPLVVSSRPIASGAGIGASSFSMSGGMVGAPGVTTMTATDSRDGMIRQMLFRLDPTKSVHVEIAAANQTGVRLVASDPPPPQP